MLLLLLLGHGRSVIHVEKDCLGVVEVGVGELPLRLVVVLLL